MAATKISDLTAGTTPQSTDESPWARAGANVKLTYEQIKDAVLASTEAELLVDTARWQELGIGATTLRFIAEHPELCRFNDQSALNHALAGKWAEVSPGWNWQAGKPETMALIDTRDPQVVHFNARQKPWRDGLRTIPAAFKDPFRDWGRSVGWTLPEDNDVLSAIRPKREAARAQSLSETYAALPAWVEARSAYLTRSDFIDMQAAPRRAARRVAR